MEPIFKEFIDTLKASTNKDRATVVYLHGDLGSGKTTFTKNLCQALGLDIDITSPTFTILKKYPFQVAGFENLIHIDAYRLTSYEDLLKIKFDEYLHDPKNLIFIEWPSIIENDQIIPDIQIRFQHLKNMDERSITIE